MGFMKKESTKSDKLPKHWSYQRKMLSDLLLKSKGYNESVKKGLPFFTIKELEKLRKNYSGGITWNEIDTELSKKGMIFKKATFRKYIQEKKIPQSRGYRATKKGREAIYPGEIIGHINLIQYIYRIADNEAIDMLLDAISEERISVKDALEEQIESGNLREGVFMYLRDMSSPDDDIRQAIEDVLLDNPEIMEKALSGLEEIYDAFHDKFSKWVKMLEDIEIPISN
jgi:hypothetical protein